jgi:uncharacterized protein (TIGR03084 family)
VHGVNGVMDALGDEHRELDALLEPLTDDEWAAPAPRCPGWDVADVMLHLAQSDELAIASATGGFREALTQRGDGAASSTADVDDWAAIMVERERATPQQTYARWRAASTGMQDALRAADPKQRVPWVASDLSVPTLATTRLSEAWIHHGDVADAIGADVEPTERLWHIARLAWRTLPYAFTRSGRELSGTVAFVLTAPDGSTWTFAPDDDAATTVTGDALDLCLVAARRAAPEDTSLVATGPDAESVLALVRTYA